MDKREVLQKSCLHKWLLKNNVLNTHFFCSDGDVAVLSPDKTLMVLHDILRDV